MPTWCEWSSFTLRFPLLILFHALDNMKKRIQQEFKTSSTGVPLKSLKLVLMKVI